MTATVLPKLKPLFKSSFIYGLSQAFYGLIGFVVVPIYTRVFSTSDYGIIDLSIVVSIILRLVLDMGLSSALIRFYYEETNSKDQKCLFSTIFFTILGFSALVSIPLFISAEPISELLFDSAEHVTILRIVFITLPLLVLQEYILASMRVKEKPLPYACITVGGMLLMVSLSILLVVHLRVGMMGVFLAQLFSIFPTVIVGLIWMRADIKWLFSTEKLFLSLAYGLPLVPAALSSWALRSVNRFIISRSIGLAPLGIYAVGAKVGSAINIIAFAFRLAWIPFAMSILDQEDAKEIYSKVFTYYLLVMTIISSLLTIFSYEIISVLTTRDYIEAYRLVGFLLAGGIVSESLNIVSLGVVIIKKTYYNILTRGLGAAVNVILNILLLRSYGIPASAVAVSLGYLATACAMYYISQKLYRIDYELRKVGWIVLFYCSIVGINCLIPQFEPLVSRLALKTAVFGVFLLSLYVTSVDKQEVLWVQAFARDKIVTLRNMVF